MNVLQDQTKPTYEQLMDIIAEQQRMLAERTARRTVSFKVSEKGAVSIYGLGQWPITLYKSQWASLEPALPALAAFFKANDARLASKPTKVIP